jgi:hypothetical protein
MIEVPSRNLLHLLSYPPDETEVGAAADRLREVGMDRIADLLALLRPSPEPSEDDAYLVAALSRLPPIFAAYFGYRGPKFDMRFPFRVGGHVYTTDGRIALRVPTPDGWALENRTPATPGVEALWDEAHSVDRVPVEVPAVEGDCTECRATGIAPPVDCDCPECDGRIRRDWRPCDSCLGSGASDPWSPVELAPGYLIARHFARSLANLGAAARRPARPEMGDRRTVALSFSAGEIEGLVMPIDPSKIGTLNLQETPT